MSIDIIREKYVKTDRIERTFEVKLLPFMKSKEASASSPVEAKQRASDEGSDSGDSDLLEIVIKELFEAKTDKERASAFRTAFQLLEQEPHGEQNG